jgi:hypothetical protein
MYDSAAAFTTDVVAVGRGAANNNKNVAQKALAAARGGAPDQGMAVRIPIRLARAIPHNSPGLAKKGAARSSGSALTNDSRRLADMRVSLDEERH